MINFIQILIIIAIGVNENVHLDFLFFIRIWSPKKRAWPMNLKKFSLWSEHVTCKCKKTNYAILKIEFKIDN
jgi:hypothetical protein